MSERKVVYFDNNATTAVDPEVFEAMLPFLTEKYGNPSSIYRFGGEVASHIKKARAQVAALIGADYVDEKLGENTEIIFTSCGTESDNAAINSALLTCPKRRKAVVSKVEHPAVLNVAKELERQGRRVLYVPVDSKGRIDLEALEDMVDEETALFESTFCSINHC